MSLETPEKIRNLQRKLYCKAKAEPAFRFYLLYDKICREDILRHAYSLARANAGAPGVDGVTFKQIDASGVEVWPNWRIFRTATAKCFAGPMASHTGGHAATMICRR